MRLSLGGSIYGAKSYAETLRLVSPGERSGVGFGEQQGDEVG